MRRSSSRQRGSALPARSMAPPVDQNRFQCARAADTVSSKPGGRPPAGFGVNTDVNANVFEPGAADNTYVCGPASVIVPPAPQRTAAWYVSASSALAKRASSGYGCERTVRCASGFVQSAAVVCPVPYGNRNSIATRPVPSERRPDAHADTVHRRVTHGFHVHRLAIEPEVADDDAVPEVERLADLGEVGGRGRRAVRARQPEADSPEVQAVRVGAEPVDLGRAVAGNIRVADHAAVAGELLEGEPVDVPAVGIRRGVPAPLGLRAERDGLLVQRRERLQAGCVDGERELAVADREGRFRVDRRQRHVVARRPARTGRWAVERRLCRALAQEARRGAPSPRAPARCITFFIGPSTAARRRTTRWPPPASTPSWLESTIAGEEQGGRHDGAGQGGERHEPARRASRPHLLPLHQAAQDDVEGGRREPSRQPDEVDLHAPHVHHREAAPPGSGATRGRPPS